MVRFKKTTGFTTYNPNVADYWDACIKEIEALYVIEGYAQAPTKEFIFSEMLKCIKSGEPFQARIELSLHKLHQLTHIPIQQLKESREGKLRTAFELSGKGIWQPVNDDRIEWYTIRVMGES